MEPRQIATSFPAFTLGNGFTVIVTVDVLTQPLVSVPVTVYVVVVARLALGLAQLVQLNPVDGVQVNVSAPVACSCAESLAHILWLLPALTDGNGLTTTVTCPVPMHPLVSTPVMVYTVVVVGLAVGLGQLPQDKPEVGDQLYVVAPVAVSCTLLPLHMDLLAPALITGSGLSFTVTVAVSMQPFASVPITV